MHEEICALSGFLGQLLSSRSTSGWSSSNPTDSPTPSLSSLASSLPPSPSPHASSLSHPSLLHFVRSHVGASGASARGPPEDGRIAAFADNLNSILALRFGRHWHPEAPSRGSAYRSLSFVNGKPDQPLEEAAMKAGLPTFATYFPANITFWIDPGNVSLRVTDHGSILTLWGTDPVHFLPPSVARTKSTTRLTPSAPLPPSPPQLSRQQLRQLKITQKQQELQEMARSLSQQYGGAPAAAVVVSSSLSLYNQQFPGLGVAGSVPASPQFAPHELYGSYAVSGYSQQVPPQPHIEYADEYQQSSNIRNNTNNSKKHQGKKNDNSYSGKKVRTPLPSAMPRGGSSSRIKKHSGSYATTYFFGDAAVVATQC